MPTIFLRLGIFQPAKWGIFNRRKLGNIQPALTHKQAQTAWEGISMEQLLEELQQIQQFALLYPPQGEKGPNRVSLVLSKQTLAQQSLAQTLGLDQLCSAQT